MSITAPHSAVAFRSHRVTVAWCALEKRHAIAVKRFSVPDGHLRGCCRRGSRGRGRRRVVRQATGPVASHGPGLRCEAAFAGRLQRQAGQDIGSLHEVHSAPSPRSAEASRTNRCEALRRQTESDPVELGSPYASAAAAMPHSQRASTLVAGARVSYTES